MNNARLLATQLTQIEREYIHRRIAAEHAVLLGDSILDNWACVPGKPAVIDQMRGHFRPGGRSSHEPGQERAPPLHRKSPNFGCNMEQ